MDYHGVSCCCHYRCRNRGWNLASPRACIAWVFSDDQVRFSKILGFFLNYSNTSSPNTTSIAQYILNDTSLAALVLPNGDRQLYFQDSSGSIRRAIRSASENQWTISPSLDLNSYLDYLSNPRNYTPLSATVYNAIEVADDGYSRPSVVSVENP